MQEPCKNCGRVECPTLGTPFVSPYSNPLEDTYERFKASSAAQADCEAHTVDWRQRALDAEKSRDEWQGMWNVCHDRDVAKDAEIKRLREAIGRLPEYRHHEGCARMWAFDGRRLPCDCHAAHANAARAEARKAAGMEP